MILNYFKIALRNLLKFKGYTAINIFGLAVGLACCLLIVQYLREEWSFDKHHKNKDHIYRVSTDFNIGEKYLEIGTASPSTCFALKKDFPEIVESARAFKAPSIEKFLIKVGDRSFYEEKGIYADSTFFRIMTYDFVAGDSDHALDHPFSVVLSSKLAKKFFPKQNPVGQSIELESLWGEDVYTVKGVFNKETYNTHIDGDFYISAMSGNVGRRFYSREEWVGNNLFYTFIQLQPNTNPKSLEAKFPAWLETYAGARLKEMGFTKTFLLEPLKDLYLYSNRSNIIGTSGNITYIYILGSIALLILLIACINFMNLATAKATVRAREVGVRKVVGANRRMLLHQFLSEAFVYTGIAIILAYIIAEISIPLFNQLTNKELAINIISDQLLLPILIGFLILTTLVAGSYPAIYLSSFHPVKILKGLSFGDQLSGKQIRKGLVVIQFIISIALIQGVLVINEQMKYIRNKNLGFDSQQKIIVPLNSPNASNNFTALKNEFLKDSRVKAAGGTSTYPGALNLEDMIMYGEGRSPEEGESASMAWVEPEYLELMEFELLEGRLYSRNRIADTLESVIINEKLAKDLGYTTSTAVGKKMFYDWHDVHRSFAIVGVVKDFHANSLHNPIEGEAFFWDNQDTRAYLVADVQINDLNSLLVSLENSWKSINPSEPFEYYFLDQQIQQNYASDQRIGGLIFWGTLMAILISSLGLLGLAAFAAERRTKEIGIRKILGASVSSIIGMLSKDFVGLILIGFVIASPIAWYGMKQWLEDFQYHINMPWWTYGLAGVLAIFVALLTIFWQSLSAARSNPVEALRRE